MSKLIITFTFTHSVEIDPADYVGQAMPDNRVIGLARELLAKQYDGAHVDGAYLLLGDADADIEIDDETVWVKE